ncbi:MAG TPA: hypothetical protein VEF91_01745, partial [Verrucomicrobiae bacterium]|nr:hypothetical protein [Verrucomicrobiae bacterium]
MSEGSNVNKNLKGRLILPALLVGTFLTLTVTIFASTLVVDIAKTFRVSIGTLTLLGLVGAFVGLFFGIAMGALTLRFRHKLLYILGAVLYGFGSLIYFFAPNITTVLLATFFLATGGSMVG